MVVKKRAIQAETKSQFLNRLLPVTLKFSQMMFELSTASMTSVFLFKNLNGVAPYLTRYMKFFLVTKCFKNRCLASQLLKVTKAATTRLNFPPSASIRLLIFSAIGPKSLNFPLLMREPLSFKNLINSLLSYPRLMYEMQTGSSFLTSLKTGSKDWSSLRIYFSRYSLKLSSWCNLVQVFHCLSVIVNLTVKSAEVTFLASQSQ